MLIYTDLVSEIVENIAATVPGLAHVRASGVAVAAATRWAGSKWGNLATCIGLYRECEPSFTIWVRGRNRTVIEVSSWYRREAPQLIFNDAPCHYLILLRLPRLFESDPLETIVHELFHIGEGFDGRLRPLRHGKLFDWSVKRLMREWIERGDPTLIELSRMPLKDLRQRFGTIVGRRLPPNFQTEIVEAVEAPGSYVEGIERIYPRYRLARDFVIRPARTTPVRVPRVITEQNCTLRYYHETGSEDLPRSVARYAQPFAVINDLP